MTKNVIISVYDKTDLDIIAKFLIKKKFTNFLINRFKKLSKININKIYFSNIHGWKYSANKKSLNIQSLWSKSLKVGICGDWFGGPRYENGWISASDLYKKITN